MPRKSRKKNAELPAGLEVAEYDKLSDKIASSTPASEPVEKLKADLGLQTADELPSFVQRLRPTGPRKRDGEPAASYEGVDVRVTKDGDSWQVEMRRDLTADEYDRLQRNGFDPVDDHCRVWNASQKEVAKAGADINVLAVMLDAKGERLAAGRAR